MKVPDQCCLLFHMLFLVANRHSDSMVDGFLVDENTVTVGVDSSGLIHVVSDKYLSVTIDTFEVKGNLSHFHASSKKFQNLAKGLLPAYLRIGGTPVDYMYFRQTTKGGFVMTERQWDTINTFCQTVGLDLIFDLNLLDRVNDIWDPTNTESLLNYTASKGYKVNFELGNEPELFYRWHKYVDPIQVGRDYATLRHLLNSYPQFRDSLLVGPDLIASFHKDWAKKFLSTGASSIDALTVHHYYTGGSVGTEAEFLSSHRMDSLLYTIVPAKEIMTKYSNRSHSVWLGETSSRSGGGVPLLSESFIAGFLWLDKLGLAATNKIDVVARQTFLGGHYSMLSTEGNPLPDYWLSLIFKKVVGRKVLNVTSSDNNRNIRIYAHCSQDQTHSGAVTFFAQNMQDGEVLLSIPQYTGQEYELYILTAGGDGSLTSKTVKLNGKEIKMNGDKLPVLNPVSAKTWPLKMPKHSFVFVVLPFAHAKACLSMNLT